MKNEVNGNYANKVLEIQTGKVAKQANGSVVVKVGDNVILVTAVASHEKREGIDYFPLMVDYREESFATGKIPGGFFKREGRSKDKEILTSRLVDRPLRPLFPDDFGNETQIIATLLSADGTMEIDTLAVIGASAALSISDIPFNGPVGAGRVAMIEGEFIKNPTFEEIAKAELDLVIAGTETTVTTIEASADEVSEEDMLKAIELGHELIRESIDIQKKLISTIDIKKMEYTGIKIPDGIEEDVKVLLGNSLNEINSISEKIKRNNEYNKFVKSIIAKLEEKYPDDGKFISGVIDNARKEIIRNKIINSKKRLDDRNLDQIRNLECEVGLLPRTHGSALFTRGETQALVGLTLGTSSDEQTIEELVGETSKSFMLHYNFPPYCVGEVSFLRGPKRREIGHGYLAEKALGAIIPSEEIFPYTIRIVSDILESNGSSSMASVCAGSLALMDAGVPIKTHVAGIAMGLIKENDEIMILSDIMGEEDHYGDMDFKVAGTKDGITALQLDTKIQGISSDILRKGFMQAKDGRNFILQSMEQAISGPRSSISQYAPRLLSFVIDKEKIGAVIGPGGKNIRAIIEETGVKINIEEDGKVTIASENEDA
ncbi:polyribonucleotide nucleotidyltransferase, partial [candidate division WOR-3 bacterium]|nr:polyribonucleotide nucleotidyltransferase [candidate division WOR-3 bacterium]